MLNFNKPAGYDEVQAGGDFTPIELGGHKLVIKKIEDVSNGVVSYLKVMYDTAPDDIQPNYFAEQYKNDTRDTKKWGGVINIFQCGHGFAKVAVFPLAHGKGNGGNTSNNRSP